MTPQEAKDRTIQVEGEIIQRLPSAAVENSDPPRRGTLMSCSTKGVYSRAGGVKIHIVPSQDPAALLPDLESSFGNDERFRVRDLDTNYGSAIQLVGADGEGYVIGTTSGENVLVIDSFSPCFVLPDTMSPLDDF